MQTKKKQTEKVGELKSWIHYDWINEWMTDELQTEWIN